MEEEKEDILQNSLKSFENEQKSALSLLKFTHICKQHAFVMKNQQHYATHILGELGKSYALELNKGPTLEVENLTKKLNKNMIKNLKVRETFVMAAAL
jgi:hypothetical protein